MEIAALPLFVSALGAFAWRRHKSTARSAEQFTHKQSDGERAMRLTQIILTSIGALYCALAVLAGAHADGESLIGTWCIDDQSNLPGYSQTIISDNAATLIGSNLNPGRHSLSGKIRQGAGKVAGHLEEDDLLITLYFELTGPDSMRQKLHSPEQKYVPEFTTTSTFHRCGQQEASSSPNKTGGKQKYADAKKCLKVVKTNVEATFDTDRGLENICNYPIEAFDCSLAGGLFPCNQFNQQGGPDAGWHNMQPHDVIGMYPKHIYGACPKPSGAVGHFDGANVQYHCEALQQAAPDSGNRNGTTTGGSQ